MFWPSVNESSQPGLPELVVKSVNQCNASYWDTFLHNIILSGGNSMFPNFGERLYAEIKKLVPGELVKIIANPDREV